MSDDAPLLRMFLAGVSSVCAGACTHPIDTLKVRLQKEGEGGALIKKYRNIFVAAMVISKEEGILALYKGLAPSLMREASYSTLRLGLYEPFKKMLGASDKHTAPLWKMFLAGLMSGSTGALIANPFDLLKIRLQSMKSSEKSGLKQEFNTILRHEGFLGFYKGLYPCILRAAILNGTQLATYDKTKQSLIKYMGFCEGLKLYFVCSFITGFMLSVTTAPVDLIKTRIMSQTPGNIIYTGIAQCAKQTFQTEGISAFYKGFFPQWIRLAPFSIIQFVVWEELRTLCRIKNI